MKEIILHDFSRPLAKRKRTHTGPYRWQPTKPMSGRGFYMQHDQQVWACATHGSGFSLRIEHASCHVRGSLTRTKGYGSEHCFEQYHPIILRLPRSRGFLSGWTLGVGMISAMDPEIHTDIADAAYAAHQLAEAACDLETEYQEAWHHGVEQRSKLTRALKILKDGIVRIRAGAISAQKGAHAAAALLQFEGEQMLRSAYDLRTDVWIELKLAGPAAEEGFASAR